MPPTPARIHLYVSPRLFPAEAESRRQGNRQRSYGRNRAWQALLLELYTLPLKSRQFHSLPTFTFATLFPVGKQTCGPGVPPLAGLRTKSIGGKIIRKEDPFVLPQGEAGLSGARSIRLDCEPGAPTSEYPCSCAKDGLPARPRKREVPHDFCA